MSSCRLDIDAPLRPRKLLSLPRMPEAPQWWAVCIYPGGSFRLIHGPFETQTAAEAAAIEMRDDATPEVRTLATFGYTQAVLGTLDALDVTPVL